MDKVLELVLKELANGNLGAVVIIILLFLIFNYQRFSNFLMERRRVKIELLEKSLADPNVQGLTKEHLEAQIETEYFHAATGMRLDRQFREIVIAVFNSADGAIKFDHFRRAQQFMSFSDGQMIIKLSVWSWLSFLYNVICGVGCFLGFIVAFIGPVFLEEKTADTLVPMYSLGVFALSVAVLFFFVSLPHISALHVKTTLKDLQEQKERIPEEQTSAEQTLAT